MTKCSTEKNVSGGRLHLEGAVHYFDTEGMSSPIKIAESLAAEVAPRVLKILEGFEEFEYCRVEVWADSGRIIVFPWGRNDADGRSHFVAQVVSDEIETCYDSFESIAGDDDDAFEALLCDFRLQIADAFLRGIKSSKLALPTKVFSASDPDPIRVILATLQ